MEIEKVFFLLELRIERSSHLYFRSMKTYIYIYNCMANIVSDLLNISFTGE